MPKMCASCWRTAISRKFSHKKWEKVPEVSRRLPPASTINNLMSTDPAKEAITILNKRSTGHLVRSWVFISVRDFLIVRLELENVQRPGPLETATVSNFREAEQGDDGSYTMYCPKHKWSIEAQLGFAWMQKLMPTCAHTLTLCKASVLKITRKPCLWHSREKPLIKATSVSI